MRLLGSGARLALLLSLLLLILRSAPVRAQEGGSRPRTRRGARRRSRSVTRCVRFDEPQISGLTLLAALGHRFLC